MGYQKKYGPMKVHEKKRKKGTHEGLKKEKKERRRDSHALKKNLQTERDQTKGVSIHHIPSTISIHVHILI